MEESTIVQQIRQKGVDINVIVRQVINNPEYIPELINVIDTDTSSVKFGCEKALRLVSERQPELIYPYFDFFTKLLDCDNTFLKCGAILTIANLTVADVNNKFETIFEKYYALISGPVMIWASNVIGSSVKIVLSKPKLTDKIVSEILKVENATYLTKGVISPECKNVACGQAIETFKEFYDNIEQKEAVKEFVKRQLLNTREKVVKSAEKFLKQFSINKD